MKNLKKLMSLLLALTVCLSMAACGKKISLADLEGFWYPPEGLGSTMSVVTCIYIDGEAETWEEYDEFGDPTGYAGAASTDGKVLTLTDVPWIGDVEIPIGDANTLVTDTGETYWIKGDPDFLDKPELSASYYGRWYRMGYQDSEFATVLTLNEDGTYTRDEEEGTYTYTEYEESVGDMGTIVVRQQISLSGGFLEDYYLVSDGQVLLCWTDEEEGNNYYIYEDALDNEQLLAEYNLTEESFEGEYYAFYFSREYTVRCEFFDSAYEDLQGTWELFGNTVVITWDDGSTDEATLHLGEPGEPDTLTMDATGDTLENPIGF